MNIYMSFSSVQFKMVCPAISGSLTGFFSSCVMFVFWRECFGAFCSAMIWLSTNMYRWFIFSPQMFWVIERLIVIQGAVYHFLHFVYFCYILFTQWSRRSPVVEHIVCLPKTRTIATCKSLDDYFCYCKKGKKIHTDVILDWLIQWGIELGWRAQNVWDNHL